VSRGGRGAQLAASLVIAASALGGCGDDGTADPAPSGPIVVSDAWVRPTAPFASVAAFYLTVENTTDRPDGLVAAESDRCPQIQLHRTELDGDTSRMREVEPGDLVVGPGEQLRFEPGGLHVMCLGFDEPFEPGQTPVLRLTFAEAGEIEITLTVEDR
jgi:copper(I)-binding protein